jgi:hypothetical protein
MSIQLPDTSARGRISSRLGIATLLAAVASLGGTPVFAATGDLEFARLWVWSDDGGVGGFRQLEIADLDGDGRDEILSGAGIAYPPNEGPFGQWTIFELSEGLQQTWSSLPISEGGYAHVAQTPAGTQIVVRATDDLQVFDGATRALLRTLPAPVGMVDFAVHDVDVDGELELLACVGTSLLVIDFATGNVDLSIGDRQCSTVTAGQADDDPQLEILILGGAIGVGLLDGVSFEIQWSDPASSPARALLVQIDSDPDFEIVHSGWQGTFGADPESAQYLWFRADLTAGSLGAGDIEPLEPGSELVAVGTIPTVRTEVISAADGETLWTVPDWPYGSGRVGVADLIGDGSIQIVMSNGPAGVDMVVLDAVSRQILAVSHRIRGPFPGWSLGDVDADGDLDLATSPADGPRVLAFDVGSRSLAYAPGPVETWSNGSHSIAAQLDVDPQLEICSIRCPECASPSVHCEDALEHEPHWTLLFVGGAKPRNLARADLEEDGIDELLVGTTAPRIYAFDGPTGSIRWQTPLLTNYSSNFQTMRIGNLDSDPGLEIIAGGSSSASSRMAAFRLEDGGYEYGPIDPGATSFDLVDIDANGDLEVVTASVTGELRVVDPETAVVSPPFATFPSRVDTIRASDFDRDGVTDFAVIQDRRIHVWGGAQASVIWQSEFLGVFAGLEDSLYVFDTDRDGIPEVLVSTGVGFALFEGPEFPLLVAGFETGDTSEWSSTLP